ncbi:hypothetical protein LTR22_002831 [Elasticomyces elasticus]|nr:hypothetical protein LTR22_002831 [Elasticomyces elasticus]KAK4910347.1 hypothetical protein LTR49_020954 [Elasticomyces elasticus]KAK5763599.1 hypothetical protein LTS12_006156 [Elasticomyces elasticus]
MKAVHTLSLLASITAATAESWAVSYLSTTQPGASTSDYSIALKVRSPSGCGYYDAYCQAQWSNSDDAPFGQWIECEHNSTDQYQDDSGKTAFQLYSDFTAGDFEINLQQNFTECSGCYETADAAEPFHVSSAIRGYTCDSDSCATASNFTSFDVPVGKSNPLNCSAPVTISFPVLERTVWGDNIFVVGNISKLGNWDPYNAVALIASSYTDANNLWTGAFTTDSTGTLGDIQIDSGTTFEYKYIEWFKNGTLYWECGENRVYTVIDDRTNQATVGDNPDVFRCGNH